MGCLCGTCAPASVYSRVEELEEDVAVLSDRLESVENALQQQQKKMPIVAQRAVIDTLAAHIGDDYTDAETVAGPSVIGVSMDMRQTLPAATAK